MNKIKELAAELKPLGKAIAFAAVLAITMSIGSYIHTVVATHPTYGVPEQADCCGDPQSLMEIDGVTGHWCYPIKRTR